MHYTIACIKAVINRLTVRSLLHFHSTRSQWMQLSIHYAASRCPAVYSAFWSPS